MREIIKNTVIIFVFTLIAGVLLGVVYQVTLDSRNAAEAEAEQEALQEVLADAESFEEIDLDDDAIEAALEEYDITSDMCIVEEANEGLDADGELVGYTIKVSDYEGYSGQVQFVVGILADGTVNGISFLTLDETPGLGMKADEDDFKGQFVGVLTDWFEVVKTGSTTDSEIDAISGATITSKAVTKGVNSAIITYNYITENIGGGDDE